MLTPLRNSFARCFEINNVRNFFSNEDSQFSFLFIQITDSKIFPLKRGKKAHCPGDEISQDPLATNHCALFCVVEQRSLIINLMKLEEIRTPFLLQRHVKASSFYIYECTTDLPKTHFLNMCNPKLRLSLFFQQCYGSWRKKNFVDFNRQISKNEGVSEKRRKRNPLCLSCGEMLAYTLLYACANLLEKERENQHISTTEHIFVKNKKAAEKSSPSSVFSFYLLQHVAKYRNKKRHVYLNEATMLLNAKY